MLPFDEPRVSCCNIFAIGKNEQGSNRENHDKLSRQAWLPSPSYTMETETPK